MNKFLVLLLPFSLMALTMEEMVQETIDKNPNMQKDIGSYRAVKYDLDKAKSGWKPNVDFRADVGYENTDKSYVQTNNQALDTSSDLVRNSASIVATENLFEGFATESGIAEQKSRILSARFNTLQNANSIALRSSEVYIDVLRQKSLLDLYEENVNSHERIYGLIREKTEAGSGRRSDVEQSEGRLALAYSNYIAQVNNYQDSIVNFERVYGEALTSSSLELPLAPSLPADTYEGLWTIAQQYNPTLLLERANIKVQEDRYTKDKGNYYPSVDLELAAARDENVQGYEGTNTNARGLLKLYYNLYRGGTDEATRLQNLEYITVQKESFNEQQRAVREKLKLAWLAQQITFRQIRCIRMHVEYSKKTAESYAQEYQLGRRSIVDLLNAELEYNDARKQLKNAQSDVLFARFRILEAIGLLNYALATNVEEKIEAEIPEDITMSLRQFDKVDLYGENENNIDINNICKGSYKPLVIKEPEPIPVVIPVSSDDIAIDDVVEYMKESKPVIMDSLTFESQSAILSAGGKKYLGTIAKDLIKNDEYILEISGHTDSIGTDTYNQKLSEQRANSAKKALSDAGVKPDTVVVIGEGELKPIADNNSSEGRAVNRRIEMKMIKRDQYGNTVATEIDMTKAVQTN
ncbi:MAG: TolC family outer membrane protein [Sulfurimonadaceae bacterium]